MSIVTAIKCDFRPQDDAHRLFEDDSQVINPVGEEYHICYTCMHRMPTPAERMRYLNVAINWAAGAESHPAYIREKTEIAISVQTLDFLLGSLDIHKQQEFVKRM